mgnify:CR=1 FL=1
MEEWFDRYTDPKMDARKGGAVGRGQEKMCYEENAFDQSIELYYKDKEKCRVLTNSRHFWNRKCLSACTCEFNVMDNMKSSMNKKILCDIPPLSKRLKWGIFVRLFDRAKHKRAYPTCVPRFYHSLDNMLIMDRITSAKIKETFFSVIK